MRSKTKAIPFVETTRREGRGSRNRLGLGLRNPAKIKSAIVKSFWPLIAALSMALFGVGLAAPTSYAVSGTITYAAHGPMGDFKGKNDAVSGKLTWDPASGKLTGKVCVDLRYWDSGEPLRDKHTRGMFETDKFPEACYRLSGLKQGVKRTP